MRAGAWLSVAALAALGCGTRTHTPQDVRQTYEERLQRLADDARDRLVSPSCPAVEPARACGLLIDSYIRGFPLEGRLVEFASKTCDEDAAEGLSPRCLDRFREDFRAAVHRRYGSAKQADVLAYCEANEGSCSLRSVGSFRLWELVTLQSHDEAVFARYQSDADGLSERYQREMQAAEAEEQAAATRRAIFAAIGRGLQAFGQGMQRGAASGGATTSASTYEPVVSGCASDYECSFGFYCVKPALGMRGTCARVVNQFGNPTFAAPRGSSVGPGTAECLFTVGDCPIGFQCVANHCMRQ